MSVKRVNSTGRVKVLRRDAWFAVHPDGDGGLTFDATIDLTDYELPPEGQVFVEAYRQTTFMRFPYGTAADPAPVPGESYRLTEFPTRDGLLFRVKVTSTGERPGLLLAEGDGIPVSDDEEQPDDRIPLLVPAPADLGQEVWQLDFSADKPLLLVNNRLDWKTVAASPIFRSLVYAAAMRQVLTRILLIEAEYDVEDADCWECRWLAFGRLLGVGDPPTSDADEAEKEEWIGDAVASFARRHQMLDHYATALATEASA